MNNSLLYKQLENEQAKAFIEKIPENIKDRCKLKKIEKGKLLVLKGNNIENIYKCKSKTNLKMDLYTVLQILNQ